MQSAVEEASPEVEGPKTPGGLFGGFGGTRRMKVGRDVSQASQSR